MANPHRQDDNDLAADTGAKARRGGEGDLQSTSWFPQTLKPLPTSDLAERYRTLRAGSYEERDFVGEQADNDSYYRRLQRRERSVQQPEEPRHEEFESRSTAMRAPLYAAAGIAAALAGGLFGYAATQYQEIGEKAASLKAMLAPASLQVADAGNAATPSNQSNITKKPISTATLEVSDVSGGLNSMIPIMLHAESGTAGEDLILEISGLPEAAYLTAGHKAQDNNWQIAATEAEGVKLVVPKAAENKFDLAIAAFEAKTGQLAAPIKEITVALDTPAATIAPASAEPDSAVTKPAEPIATPKSEEVVATAEVPAEAQNLAAKGDMLLKSGDIAMARRFYEQAFAKGSIDAAIGAGRTYDPIVYATLRVQGLKPDPARAMEWYMRASAAGNKDAEVAIEALKKAEP